MLAKLGFTPASMHETNPKLIYCAVSGFGHDSAYAGRPAFDSVVQAMSGMMDVIRAGGMPLKSGPSSADVMGGQLAVVAILAALEHRERTGEGQTIDLAMHDVAAWLTQTRWNGATPAVSGATIRCSDGYVYADASAEDFERATAVAGEKLTRAQCQAVLEEHGISATAINTVGELVAHEQTLARGLWTECRLEDGKVFPLLGSPFRLSAMPTKASRPMGVLNGDRASIL
ncbi:hypothetical protein BZM26_00800 [Paraburkholderia strydomiana]|nr:hypothetical protein BZM26_00800 [Paraburkholderia strydomiana]